MMTLKINVHYKNSKIQFDISLVILTVLSHSNKTMSKSHQKVDYLINNNRIKSQNKFCKILKMFKLHADLHALKFELMDLAFF